MKLHRRFAALVSVVVFVAPACGGGSADDVVGSTVASEPAQSSTTMLPPPPEAVVAGAFDGAALGAPYLDELRFDWPQDCAVPVVEEVRKSGQTALLRYRLGLEADGSNTRVTFEDMVVTSVDGNPVPDEAGTAMGAQFTLPGFLVDPEGTVVELVGMDALIDQLNALDPEANVEMTPEFVALVEESVTDKYWGSWVGTWASWGFFDEATEIGTSEFQIGSEVATSDIVTESLGTVDGGAVALRSTITLDGADFALAMGGVMATVANPTDSATTQEIVGQRVITVEVVTDPATLRPTSAFTSIAIELTADGETRSQLEERRWIFEWSACS